MPKVEQKSNKIEKIWLVIIFGRIRIFLVLNESFYEPIHNKLAIKKKKQ